MHLTIPLLQKLCGNIIDNIIISPLYFQLWKSGWSWSCENQAPEAPNHVGFKLNKTSHIQQRMSSSHPPDSCFPCFFGVAQDAPDAVIPKQQNR